MEILTGIAAAKQALDIARGMRSLEQSFDQATMKSKLVDLIDALSDAKLALIDAKETLAERDRELSILKANFEISGALVKADGEYEYFTGENGKPFGFPVCPSCRLEGSMIQLKQDGASFDAKCPKCKSKFTPVTCYLGPQDTDVTLTGKEKRVADEKYKRGMEGLARFNSGARLIR